MAATMHANQGMGLAATQVGQPIRLIAVEYIPEDPGELEIPLTFLVNPTITDSSKKTDWMDEGCLSIPGVEVPVERSKEVNVLAQDLNGNRVKIRAKDLFARILQHEIDHTDGILITDRAFPDTKELAGKRIIFMGTPNHAIPYLAALAATDATIVAVITETDKPAGRNHQITAPPIKKLAQELKLPLYQFESLKSEEARQTISNLAADLGIVIAYGQIIPKDVLAMPRLGWLNVHYSLLPQYRGPSPYQTAILNGEKETGYTIFKLDSGVDTGPIIAQKRVTIENHDTSQSLIAKMIRPSVNTLLEVLPAYVAGKRLPKPQDDSQASHTRLFSKDDGRINWDESVQVIDRQIRAMQPWPTAFTEVDGQRIIIHAAHINKGKLSIDVVQPAGKQPMAFRDYLRGNHNRLTFFQLTGKVMID